MKKFRLWLNRWPMVVVFITFFALGYLYYTVKISQDRLMSNIETIYTREARQIGRNISTFLLEKFDGELKEKLGENPSLRHEMEKAMRLVLIPPFQYVYMLYVDEKGHFRYLVDTTENPEEHGTFKERFVPTDTSWLAIYRNGKPHMLVEKNIHSIWGTYLYPIRYKDKTEAMLVIDFASKFPTHIKEIIKPIYETFQILFILVAIFVFLILLQIYNNYRIEKAAMRDPLTGAYNRQFLRKFLKSIDPSRYAVLMVDIDHFKMINDTYGHKIGDRVLQYVTAAISRSIRPGDILIRYGGEEFLILIEKSEESSIKQIAERIRRGIEKSTFTHKNIKINVTVSLGAVERPETFKRIADAIKRADEMLYLAKRSGRNIVMMDADQTQYKRERIQVPVDRIRSALDHDRIICHYQPIYDLQKGEIVKYEALMRMIDEDGQTLLPYRFLQGILHTSLYADLTKKVIEIVMTTIEKKKIACSLNLNVSDLMDNTIYDNLIKELEKRKNLCHFLTIELLEYESVEESEIKPRFEKIRSLGVIIAIDDFGSGFANFSLFQELTVDLLKIDGKIVKEAATSTIAYNIVKNIHNFARDLNIPTVAEFVHDDATLRIVRELDIEYGQGFYLAEPGPLED